MKTFRRVFVLVETSSGYSRGILEGIGLYRHEHPEWSIFFEERGLEELPPRWLKSWRGDGIIARTATPRIRRQLESVKVPRVELLGLQEDEPAKVHGDNRAAGRMAAAHLMGCGLRHFGFFAGGDPWWIANCRQAFCEELQKFHFSCSVYQPPVKDNRILPRWHESQEAKLTRWLHSLPQPCGVFCVTDARIVLEFCRRLNISVPERMAILGEDEDPVVCCVSSPPLSAIDFGSKEIGYRAGALLDRMMAGARRRKPSNGSLPCESCLANRRISLPWKTTRWPMPCDSFGNMPATGSTWMMWSRRPAFHAERSNAVSAASSTERRRRKSFAFSWSMPKCSCQRPVFPLKRLPEEVDSPFFAILPKCSNAKREPRLVITAI